MPGRSTDNDRTTAPTPAGMDDLSADSSTFPTWRRPAAGAPAQGGSAKPNPPSAPSPQAELESLSWDDEEEPTRTRSKPSDPPSGTPAAAALEGPPTEREESKDPLHDTDESWDED